MLTNTINLPSMDPNFPHPDSTPDGTRFSSRPVCYPEWPPPGPASPGAVQRLLVPALRRDLSSLLLAELDSLLLAHKPHLHRAAVEVRQLAQVRQLATAKRVH